MAEQIDVSELRRAGRPEKYDWRKWLNGEAWLLVRGEDYETKDASMRMLAHKAGGRRGLKVKTWPHERGVVVKAEVEGEGKDGD